MKEEIKMQTNSEIFATELSYIVNDNLRTYNGETISTALKAKGEEINENVLHGHKYGEYI